MEHKSKGNILVILLITMVAVLSLAAAGYLFIQNRQLQNQTVKPISPVQNPPVTNSFPQTPVSPSVAVPSQPVNPKTANWKTYEDDKYKFLIKYPPSWELQKVTSSDPNDRYQYSVYFKKTSSVSDMLDSISIKDNWSVNEELQRIDTRDQQGPTTEIIGIIKNFTVAGLPAKRFIYSTPLGTEPQETVLQVGNRVFVFISSPIDSDFEEVIKSFKFL